MRYADFKLLVASMCWTMPQLRCDEPPSEDLLVLIDAIGLGRYEQLVLALQAEQTTPAPRAPQRQIDDPPPSDYRGCKRCGAGWDEGRECPREDRVYDDRESVAEGDARYYRPQGAVDR